MCDWHVSWIPHTTLAVVIHRGMCFISFLPLEDAYRFLAGRSSSWLDCNKLALRPDHHITVTELSLF